MNILVTGASGFIGSHLVCYLKNHNISVKSMCRKNNNIHNYIYGDVTNLDSLTDAFKGIDVVIHAAGITDGLKENMLKVNIEGTQNVVSAVIKRKVQKLIHISSTATVGATFKPESLTEESYCNLAIDYFQSKFLSEQIVNNAVTKKQITATILNPTQVYGPRDMKKSSRQSLHLKIAQGKFLFYPTGGVSTVDIQSVVEAIYTAIKKGANGERYILSGENLYTKDLFALIANLAGVRKPFIPVPKNVLLSLGNLEGIFNAINVKPIISYERALLGVLFHWFDATKAKKELSFNPKPAKDTLSISIKWAKENNFI